MITTSELYKQAVVKSTRASVPVIFFGMYDVTAKPDASPSTVDSQQFTDVNQIVDDIVHPSINVGTLEQDYFLMDGSYQTPPNDLSPADYLGWWSQSQSNLNCDFGNPPYIVINFLNELHSSLGIGLFFDDVGGSYCSAFKVTWYQNGEAIADIVVENNKSPKIHVEKPVENYNKIVIEFLKTDAPFRYARLLEVNFGMEEEFDADKLIAASVIEEVDPSGGLLSINSMRFSAINENQRFNMINPVGVYGLLQNRQRIVAETGVVLPNGRVERIPLGVFYLSNWKNATGLSATLEATDAMGLMDKTIYYSSPFWVDEPLINVIRHILDDAGGFPCVIDPSVAGEVVNGYIPVSSHREAIQTVLLSSRAIIRDNRRGSFSVSRADYLAPPVSIGYDVVIGNPVIEQKPLVTGVEVTQYSYSLGSSVEVLYELTFSLDGTDTLVVPYEGAASGVSHTIAGGVVLNIAYSAVAAVVTIQATGIVTLTLSGKRYTENTTVVSSNLTQLPASETRQMAKVANNKLVVISGKEVADWLLAYYQKRVKQTFSYWSDPSIQAGDVVSVENMFGGHSNGIIERQEIEFAPSLKSRLEVTG